MKIEKAGMSVAEIAADYFGLAESILQAMIDSTLKKNLPVVFVLNRPFLHACYKGMWLALADEPKEIPDELARLGRDIDAKIDRKFESWNTPFKAQNLARYESFLGGQISPQLSAEGKVKASTLIERLHNDVHGGLPSLGFYRGLAVNGSLLHSAKELCIVGHSPFYQNLRLAMAMEFPTGPVRREDVLADPLAPQILKIYEMAD